MLRAEEHFLSDSPLQIRKATVQLSMEGGSLRFWCQRGGAPSAAPLLLKVFLMLKGSFRETVGNSAAQVGLDSPSLGPDNTFQIPHSSFHANV